jgi:hypothetical protein
MRRLVSIASVAAALAVASPASADDDVAPIILGIVVGGGVIGGDIALTALMADAAGTGAEQSTAVMVFQTAFVAPQAVLAHVPLVIGVTESDDTGDDDDMFLGLAGMLSGFWANTMLTYSSWSLAESNETPRTRLGVSLLVGANLTLTVGALASFTRDGSRKPVAPLWLATPEMVMGATGTAFGIFKAVDDPSKVPGWIALTTWSAAVFTHGLVSSIVLANGSEETRVVGEERVPPDHEGTYIFAMPMVLPGADGPAYGFGAAGLF